MVYKKRSINFKDIVFAEQETNVRDVYLFVTLTSHNTFAQYYYYDPDKEKLKPLANFKSLGQMQSNKKEKLDDEELIIKFAHYISPWLPHIPCKKNLIIVFKNIDKEFKPKRSSYYGINKGRAVFIETLEEDNVQIEIVVDKSAIAFNGCKASVSRRKRPTNLSKYKNYYVYTQTE
jgi:hypothetical protein